MIRSNRNGDANLLLSFMIALIITLPTLQKISPIGQIPSAALAKGDVLSHEFSAFFNLDKAKTPFSAKVNLGTTYSTLEPYATTPNYLGPDADFVTMIKISTSTVVTIYNSGHLKISTIERNGIQYDSTIDLKDSKTDPLCTHAVHEQY